jgi:hypothetical protein
MDRTGLKILENNKNIQSIISVNTNILLRRFRLKFLRIMCSTSCYKERVNFENTLYTNVFQENYLSDLKSKIPVLKRVPKAARPLVSNELTNVINDVVEKNTDVTWYKLFLFTYAV